MINTKQSEDIPGEAYILSSNANARTLVNKKIFLAGFIILDIIKHNLILYTFQNRFIRLKRSKILPF